MEEWSDLHAAVQNDDAAATRQLLEERADPNEPCGVKGSTLLHYAAAQGKSAALKVLIEGRADLNRRDVLKRTPLEVAESLAPKNREEKGDSSRRKEAEVVTFLLEGRADPDTITTRSPLSSPQSRATASALVARARYMENTNFKPAYDAAAVPTSMDDYIAAVRLLVRAFVDAKGRGPRSDSARYVQQLQIDCPAGDVAEMAEKCWTSARVLNVADGDYELCMIMNWALWEDTCCTEVASIIRALNLFCVGGTQGEVARPLKPPPVGGTAYRGGGFLPQHRSFFREGLKFRVPAVLPTSPDKAIALSFAARSTKPEKILWEFEFQDFCSHVNHIMRRAAGVPDEDEWLFTAYSPFEILPGGVTWRAGTMTDIHHIKLKVMIDSRDESLRLPCSPWA